MASEGKVILLERELSTIISAPHNPSLWGSRVHEGARVIDPSANPIHAAVTSHGVSGSHAGSTFGSPSFT
jgi:hypothetical protein